ncbi:Kelch repeat-containing protein [Lignipirellula cremea]|uniref:Kelch motif protein n=1 Tax=Lignipirellula cremea TaxID=2528010 RepID=A0A518DM82_9BACT|nr:kelch repeat-containing protein [Lignipirellula cremea]QDU92950.1 Kelch motif protein [Lignipirellula cremea]
MKLRFACRSFLIALACGMLATLAGTPSLFAQPSAGTSPALDNLPANTWTLLHTEDASGGKTFAKAVMAGGVGRLYLWGTGGEKPARNVYRRYELEAFDPASPGWLPAFPASKQATWKADEFPPFRILGQNGPDGLRHDEGPRQQVVGGYHTTNRIQWWDFDGVMRPSPALTFNMACWDSERQRILYYADRCTFALDPKTNSWTDLQAENHPTTCGNLAWASMAYDPQGDRVLLFGGGLATNPSGSAPTWSYDCRQNRWSRLDLPLQPPPRCNGSLVYEPGSHTLVLFGGYDQAAALNDTWVFDLKTNRWEERRPAVCPPPMEAPAAAAVAGGVLVCEADQRKFERHHAAATSAAKETWFFQPEVNRWTPLDASLTLPGSTWLTADASSTPGVVLLVALGGKRQTFAFRPDLDALRTPVELPGAEPGSVAWKYPEQRRSLAEAPAPDRAANLKRLADLPVNQFVNAEPPGHLVSKTWSTAVMDTDRSEVLYTGGGHSGYSGNDVARYSIADNRWTQDQPPRFPPYLEGTNAGIYGWSYGMRPFSQHTYLWYCYDPASKSVVYLARPAWNAGDELQLTDNPDNVLIYDPQRDGYASWVYDSAGKKMRPPSLGRSFKNDWHLSLVAAPSGVYATSNSDLYRGKVDAASGSVTWEQIDDQFPPANKAIKYHYEFQPLIYDSQRNRLLKLKGDAEQVEVFARSLDASAGEKASEDAGWRRLETTGQAAIGREAVYLPKHDTVLWLGQKLYAYHCGTGRLSQVDVEVPAGSLGHECALVYDPQHDVCVALIPSRFSGPMQTFLFRYQPAP